MNSQTYYVTNSTPQNSKFNGGIWNSLENAVRDAIPANDTLYVATGAAFQKIGEATKEVIWILPQDESNVTRTCPVPNFYWKVLLKVKRNGEGNVTSAKAVGFWFEHLVTDNDSYTKHAVSVDEIEQWTGFDFFVNLPDTVEDAAETNSDWTQFQSF